MKASIIRKIQKLFAYGTAGAFAVFLGMLADYLAYKYHWPDKVPLRSVVSLVASLFFASLIDVFYPPEEAQDD